jgi:arylmalonate decarboxylase
MENANVNPYLDGVKVGLIVPSVNTTTEPEFAWIAPPGISFHGARVFLDTTTPDALRAMNAEVRHATRLLATLSPDVVAYACTAGSFVDGPDATRALMSEMRAIANCAVVATSAAMVDALHHLGVTRMALASPYPEDVTEAERCFLAESGFEVVACDCLGRSGAGIRPTTFDEIFALVRGVDRPRAEAIFVSCTDLRALEMVDRLERALGKPVLTSNQVTLWAILRALNRTTPVTGFGRLLTHIASRNQGSSP